MSEPSGQADLATGLTHLATLMLSVESAEEALQHLAQMAVVVVPDGPTCGITVPKRGGFITTRPGSLQRRASTQLGAAR